MANPSVHLGVDGVGLVEHCNGVVRKDSVGLAEHCDEFVGVEDGITLAANGTALVEDGMTKLLKMVLHLTQMARRSCWPSGRSCQASQHDHRPFLLLLCLVDMESVDQKEVFKEDVGEPGSSSLCLTPRKNSQSSNVPYKSLS